MSPDGRVNVSPFDYTREQVDQLRRDFKEKFDHEIAYRKQYGEMAAQAMVALSEQGWVSLKLRSLEDDIVDLKDTFKDESAKMKAAQSRIFITAFSVLISVLTLLITVIFGILTGR